MPTVDVGVVNRQMHFTKVLLYMLYTWESVGPRGFGVRVVAHPCTSSLNPVTCFETDTSFL